MRNGTAKRWLLFFVVVLGLCLSGGSAAGQIDKNGPMAKLTDRLVKLHNQYATYLTQRTLGPFSSDDGLIPLVEDRVVVDAVASGDANALKTDLESLGMQHAAVLGRIVSGELPVSALASAARLATLQFAQPATAILNVGSVTSQGDQAMRSDVARATFGVNGSGVTVGVLSDSFNCLGGAATDVASGDLSPVTVLQESSTCGGSSGGTDEGRAMLQIVHDIAPGASLAFATANGGTANLANNILALKNSGANVIVDDAIYPNELMFQDGIVAQAVNNVVAGGAAYFSSAGNWARNSYQSAFKPGGKFDPGAIPSAPGVPPFFGGTAHNFDPGSGTDVFQRITLPPGAGLSMSLQWDSPAFSVSGAPGSPNDLDVYVLNSNATQVVAAATFDNLGRDPVELCCLSFTNTTGTTADFNIMIVNFTGPNPGFIKYVLFNFGGTIQEFASNSSTIFGHANAVGAEAVGAVRYTQTPAFGVSPPQLEPFSSSGGTPIFFDLAGNRLSNAEIPSKPEIVAPDGVVTTMAGFSPFFGTSSASPHAAGVAALILQAKPGSTPLQIYSALENTAIDMGPPGFDYDSGFGLLQADAALAVSPNGLSNISTRGSVLTGDNVMIGGFIIQGSLLKQVLIRARGPSISGAPFSIPGTLADTFLQVFSGSTLIAQNNDWQTTDPLCASTGFICGAATEISATGLDPCRPNPGQVTSPPGCAHEAAILITLPPGGYTAIESGVGGGTGIGLVEVFEVDGGASPSKLINISTRGRVETGNNVTIGGFIIGGSSAKTVLIRARGPSISGAPFFVPGTLANPSIRLFSGQTAIAQNDDWQTADPLCESMGFVCGGATEITATGSDPCVANPGQSTPPPGCAQESAILINLPPGAYTAMLSGVGGGTGVGLIEVFKLN